jgi:hypothetical protein
MTSLKRLTLVWSLVTSVAPASASCPIPNEAHQQSLAATTSDEERLHFLQGILLEESDHARTWSLVFAGSYALLTVVQLAIIPLFPAHEKVDWYLGAISSGIGAMGLSAIPLDVLESGPRFDRQVRSAAAEDACRLITEGERLLVLGAKEERDGVAWYYHVGNVVVNSAIALILGLGYGRWESAMINLGVGVAVGELNILTSPFHLVAANERYHRLATPTALSLRLQAGPGLGFSLHF